MEKSYSINEPNKIYILGQKNVGKTSFLRLLFGKPFDENIKPSKLGIVSTHYKNNNSGINITIKEITDDEEFKFTNILKNDLEEVLLIFIIFAIDNQDSFDFAQNMVSFIQKHLINNKSLSIILLGNKYELLEKEPDKVKIHRNDVDIYIENLEDIYYYQISCKTNYNIPEVIKIINDIEVSDDEGTNQSNKENEDKKKETNEDPDQQRSSCGIF